MEHIDEPDGGITTKRVVQGVQLYYKSNCVSSRKPLARLAADGVAAAVATLTGTERMKTREHRNCLVQVRLTSDEMALVKTLMENAGYPTVSCYLRDVITRKRLPERRFVQTVDDAVLREKMNALIYQVNRIGVNYNQFVATYQRQSKQIRKDGTPYVNTRMLDGKVTALMRCTEGLRDEFAVMLDIIKRYINPTQQTQP